MPTAHARLSPSASARWINCPASIRMEAHAPRGEDSVYAAEGTTAHALGEIEAGLAFGILSHEDYAEALHFWELDFKRAGYTPDQRKEMGEHVEAYVELIRERLDLYPHSTLLLERRVDTGVPDCWGTADAIIVSPTHVEVIDLKYGAGVPVSAVGNSQLRLYGCGALDTYGDMLGDTEVVRVTVFQPRLNSTSTEELTADELREWRELVVKPAAALAQTDDAPFGPSEAACRWCPVAGICRARVEKNTQEDFGASPDVLSPTELGELLTRLPEIKAWVGAVEDTALDMAYTRGEHIPGWKVVLSGGKRYIADHAAAIQTLIDEGFKAEQVAKPFQARGIGDLERLVGKKRLPEVLGDLLQKSRGKESLAPESDKRPAISPASEAVREFSADSAE